MQQASSILLGSLLLIIAVAVWQLFGPATSSIPLPSQILYEFHLKSSLIASEAMVTIVTASIGFLGALTTVAIFGVAIASIKSLRSIILPLSVFLQVTPKIAFAPIIYLIVEAALYSKAILSGVIAFFPLLIAIDTGLRRIEAPTSDLIKQLGFSKLQSIFLIILPSLMPWLLSALKLALIYAVLGAVTAEFVKPGAGLGNLVLEADAVLNRPLMFAAVLACSLLGLVIWGLASLIEIIVLRSMGLEYEQSGAGINA